jgi:hypothetical protein
MRQAHNHAGRWAHRWQCALRDLLLKHVVSRV